MVEKRTASKRLELRIKHKKQKRGGRGIVVRTEQHPTDKLFRQDIPGTSERRRRDIPNSCPGTTKTLCKAPFSVALHQKWPGCPAVWVGMSRDLGAHLGHLEKLNARKLWADFLAPYIGRDIHGTNGGIHVLTKPPLTDAWGRSRAEF